jgi:hypothetical protein
VFDTFRAILEKRQTLLDMLENATAPFFGSMPFRVEADERRVV